MQQHQCETGQHKPEGVGDEWDCPDCGRGWVATRVKYMDWPYGRVPEGFDPDMLGWRGRSAAATGGPDTP